jgi:ankyrin repeat protein
MIYVGGMLPHACFCSNGMAPIHLAAGGGHSSALELLVSKNADVNAKDE